MNNKKIYIIVSLILFVILYTISILVFGIKDNTIINKPVSNLLTKQPRLEDDFYDYVNYKYLSENHLDDDTEQWMYLYSDAGKKIKEEKKNIINTILNKCDSYKEGSINNKICIIYNNYNESKNNNKNKEDIDKYINQINNLQTLDEYLNYIYKLDYDLSEDIVTNVGIYFQPSNYKKPYFTMNLLSYDYGVTDKDYYNNDDYIQELNKFKKYDINILTTYRYTESEANKMVESVQNMYKEISRFAINSIKLEDKGYKIYKKDELQSMLKNIKIDNITKYYSNLYNGKDNILVTDINQLLSMDEYLKEENLNTLKNYAILKILTDYSKYINDEFYTINSKFENDMSGNLNYVEEKDDIIYEIIYEIFTDTITNEFANKNFSKSEKTYYTNLVKEELNAFKERILKEDWLTDTTKKEALKKIDNMKYTIGVPDELIYTEKQYNYGENSSFIDNIINSKNVFYNEMNSQYKKGNISYGIIDSLEQNAYYLPDDNSINILLGEIYTAKLAFGLSDDLDKDYYKILGSLGFTIGHELSHAFDSSGSKYDENGNFIDWWTKEDKEKFNQLNNKVIKYYNQYNQYGSQTLGENIADLGGMSLVIQLAENKNASTDNYKELFETYTLSWCTQELPYIKVYLLNSDEHSPNKNRVNAVLSSTNKFYEIYGIKENDKMFKPIEDRVSVW